MLTFSQSKEVQFVYISVHKHPYLKLMASMETKYLKELDGTYSQNRRQGYSYRGNKKLGDKVPIRATHTANPSHSSTGRELNLSKIDGNGGQESENFCQETKGWGRGVEDFGCGVDQGMMEVGDFFQKSRVAILYSNIF